MTIVRWLSLRFMVWRTKRLVRKGDADRAEALAIRYVRAHPDDAWGWFRLGFLIEGRSVLQGAREAYEHAVEADPDLTEASAALARVLIGLGELNAAEALIETDRARHPDDPLPLLGLADLASRRGQAAEVRRYVDEALDAPKPMHTRDIGRLLYSLAVQLAFLPGDEGRLHAIVLLTRALKVNPRAASANLLLAILLEDDDPERARQLFDRARRSQNVLMLRRGESIDDRIEETRRELQALRDRP